jgi:hypothetical protein
MSESPVLIGLKDPLSQVTRAERRMLLGISALSIFVTSTGLIPTRVSALGVDFGQSDQRALLLVLALVVGYFLVAFIVYGLTDYLSWRITGDESRRSAYLKFYEQMHTTRKERDEMRETFGSDWISQWPKHVVQPATLLRGAFEFFLPIAVGAYAIFSLLQKQA